MRDIALQIAGALAIFVAIVHGVIAELQVFPKARIESRETPRHIGWRLMGTVVRLSLAGL